MLYDKRWDRQVTGLPLWSLTDFEAWLTTKDPNEHYDFIDSTNCAAAQYLKARGAMDAPHLDVHTIPQPIRGLVNASGRQATFGRLLRRVQWERATRYGRIKMWFGGRAPSWIERA